MHDQSCTCNTCNKARGCQVDLHIDGQAPVYNVKSPVSGNTYKVTFNPNGNVTCNCDCGSHIRQNPHCAHTRAARWFRMAVPA